MTDGVDIRESHRCCSAVILAFSRTYCRREYKVYWKALRSESAEIEQRSTYLLKQVSLYEHKDRIAGVFSGGMKQRLSLAASIMSNPKILFMDEPTTGLDPQSRIGNAGAYKGLEQAGHDYNIYHSRHGKRQKKSVTG